MSTDGGRQTRFSASVTNWTWYSKFYRVVATCTDQLVAYPIFRLDGCNYTGHCYPLGDYGDYWVAALRGTVLPGDKVYAPLVPRVFCWGNTYSGCSSLRAAIGWRASAAAVPARPGGNTFALRNGVNRISLTFRTRRGSLRPPVIGMSGGGGCRSQRMRTSVDNGGGRVELVLACKGLRSGGAVRLTIGPAIVRRFRLGRRSGTLHVRLDKPLGTVAPYAHVSYGRAGASCKDVSRQLVVRPRTFDLRITVRCGRVPPNSIGHLYVGGLLAVP